MKFQSKELTLKLSLMAGVAALKLIKDFALPFATTLVAMLLLPAASFNVLTLSSDAIMRGLRELKH